MINPEAFVMFQFLSIYLPSDPSWMSKSVQRHLLFLGDIVRLERGPTFLPSYMFSPEGCSALIVSQGFVEEQLPPTFSIGFGSCLLTFRIHTKIYLFGKLILPLPIDCLWSYPPALELTLNPHPIDLWASHPSCFTHLCPDSLLWQGK